MRWPLGFGRRRRLLVPRLTDIWDQSIAAVEVPGRSIKLHHAVEHAVPFILADQELTEVAVRGFSKREIEGRLCGRRRKSAVARTELVEAWAEPVGGGDPVRLMVPRQGDLFLDPFQLHEAYALEGGSSERMRTRWLTQDGFRGAIRIRRKQHAADGKHLGWMEHVDGLLAPYWANDPLMTYEEVCAIYVRVNGMPELPDDDEEDG
jgi:hypothetical protein